MSSSQNRYANEFLNLSCDFGFKRFMEDKTTLLRFINAVIPSINITDIVEKRDVSSYSAPCSPTNFDADPEIPNKKRRLSIPGKIRSEVEILNQEEKGDTSSDKSIIYDLVCKTNLNEYVNVEMQSTFQAYYFHRAMFYSSRLISRQGFAGSGNRFSPNDTWTWCLHPTYHIAIINFEFSEKLFDIPRDFHDCWMIRSSMAINGNLCQPVKKDVIKPYSNVLNILMISLKSFMQSEAAKNPVNELEKFSWMFSCMGKHEIVLPEWLKSEAFKDILAKIDSNTMNYLDQSMYHASLKRMKDLADNSKYNFEEGLAKGREEGREEGLAKGREEGREEGLAKGREEGHEEGLAKGREEGREEVRQEARIFACEASYYRMLSESKSKEEIIRILNESFSDDEISAVTSGLTHGPST